MAKLQHPRKGVEETPSENGDFFRSTLKGVYWEWVVALVLPVIGKRINAGAFAPRLVSELTAKNHLFYYIKARRKLQFDHVLLGIVSELSWAYA